MKLVKGPWPNVLVKRWTPPSSEVSHTNLKYVPVFNYNGTSNTSNRLEFFPTELTFITDQTDLSYVPGMQLRFVSSPSGFWMEGSVVSYSGTTLVVNITSARNDQFIALTNWSITLATD